MELNTLSYQKNEEIGYLTLSNPPKNEMCTLFFSELALITKQINNDPIKGLILNAQGRHFSSGVNITELLHQFNKTTNKQPTSIHKNLSTLTILRNLKIPVIACLKGICIGSAFELALTAHFRIAAENTIISLPETSFGLSPGLEGIYRTAQHLTLAQTMEFILTGNSFNAQEALKNGLVDKITNKNQLISVAKRFIERIHANYNPSMKNKYKKLLNDIL